MGYCGFVPDSVMESKESIGDGVEKTVKMEKKFGVRYWGCQEKI